VHPDLLRALAAARRCDLLAGACRVARPVQSGRGRPAWTSVTAILASVARLRALRTRPTPSAAAACCGAV
jgi:hypothetical protein